MYQDGIPEYFHQHSRDHYRRQARLHKEKRANDRANAQASTLSAIQTLLDRLEITEHSLLALPYPEAAAAKTEVLDKLCAHPLWTYSPGPALKIDQCSTSWGVFADEHGLQVHPFRCRSRACPICASIRNVKLRTRFRASLKSWTTPKHVTLTLRSSGAPLRDQLDRLLACFKKLRRRHCWKRRTPYGFWTIEVTWNASTSTWHPHLHIICNMPYLGVDALKEAWSEVTGDSFMCAIKAVRGDISTHLSKYISKSCAVFLNAPDIYQALGETHHKRMVQTFGRWPKMPAALPSGIIYLGSVRHYMRAHARGDPQATSVLTWVWKFHRHAYTDTLLSFVKWPPQP